MRSSYTVLFHIALSCDVYAKSFFMINAVSNLGTLDISLVETPRPLNDLNDDLTKLFWAVTKQ